ncbi:MAG: FHA domain-containing protein [Longispora sp.]|nr:FHA domain-containing protein [Longispora sp. (in: high G+C Gram-positive bacteria)]
MRFEVSRVLDAIEERLSIDPVLAGAILNVGEVLFAVELDGGRPAYLPRVGTVIDALAKELGDAAAPVYGIVDRALLSSLELTSNEKMVLRRWADDGLVEVIADVDPLQRMAELAQVTGLPVVSRAPVPGDGRWLAPMPGAVGVVVVERRAAVGGALRPTPDRPIWRCPDGETVLVPLQLDGVPCCPRHSRPLVSEGTQLPAMALTAWVGGVARQRFAVTEGNPVSVGRSPGEGVMLGPWLNDESLQWISRVHVDLTFTGGQLAVVDRSTNGTALLDEQGQRIELTRDESRVVAEKETVELYRGVYVARPGWRPREAVTSVGVMAEAPTVALRLPQL